MNIAVCLVASFLYSLLFVFSWREKRRVNRIFSAYLLGMGLWTSTSVMWFADFPVLGDLPWLQMGTFFGIIAWMLMCRLSAAILGLDSVPAVRVGLWAIYGLGGLLLIGDLGGQLVNVTRIERGHFDVQFGGLMYLFFALAGLSGVALTFLFARAGAKTDDHNQRNRLLYFAMSNILIIIGGLANLSPQLRSFPVDVLFDVIAALLMAYAIYRYQLLDITLVVRKGLLYLIPTAIIGVLYFVIIFFIVQVLHAFVGYQILLLSLLIAVVSVMLVQPLRERAQAWVDRLFFREKYDAYQMLQKLSRGATSIIHLEELLNMIFEELAERMHIARMGVFLKEEKAEEFRLAAQRGLDEELAHLSLRNDHAIVNWLAREKGVLTRHEMDVDPHFKAYWGEEREELERMGAELFISLMAKDELVGILAVGPKLSEVTYSQDDQLALATLADQVAISIENARLYKEAQKELAERKRAEEELREHREHLEELVAERTAELRESENKLRAQYKGIPVPTYTWQKVGEDLVLVDYNDAALEITQGGIANFVGTKATEMYRDRPEIREEIGRCFAAKTVIEREMPYHYTTTGESRHLAVKYAFVPPDLVLVHTEDITPRVRAQEEIEKRSAELRKMVNLMAGREVRMAELKRVIKNLRAQIEEAGMTPVADDPLGKHISR